MPLSEQQLPLPLDQEEEDTYDLAKSFFDAKELDRAAWVLRSANSTKAIFLRLYARYLVRFFFPSRHSSRGDIDDLGTLRLKNG